MYRTTPFQNPATARTAGSCERTGATKAPVLSPAAPFVPRKASRGEETGSLCTGGTAAQDWPHPPGGESPKEGTQPLTRPNRGCFPSLRPSACRPRKVGPGFRPDRRSSGGAESDKVGQALCLPRPRGGTFICHRISQNTPCSIMASATRLKPAMFAPATRS